MNKKIFFYIDLDAVLVKKCPFLDARFLGRLLQKSSPKYKIQILKRVWLVRPRIESDISRFCKRFFQNKRQMLKRVSYYKF